MEGYTIIEGIFDLDTRRVPSRLSEAASITDGVLHVTSKESVGSRHAINWDLLRARSTESSAQHRFPATVEIECSKWLDGLDGRFDF